MNILVNSLFHLQLLISNIMILVLYFSKNIYKTLSYKTLHYNLDTFLKYFLTTLSSLHSYIKIIHTSHTSMELTLQHKVAGSPIPPRLLIYLNKTITTFISLQHQIFTVFPTVPHTYFSTKFRTTFTFKETFTTDKPDTCATIMQNSTNHVATLPTGNIGYL